MKVYLSSTAQDLAAHRQVADDTILRLRQQSVVMERFGPLPDTPAAESECLARECDVLVCIVAYRLGFVPEKEKGSITRREVEAARAAGREVLAWIVDESYPWTAKKEQDRLTDPMVLTNSERVAAVVEDIRALNDFKEWLRASVTCDTFTTPEDLGRRLAIALQNRSNERRAPMPALTQGEIRVIHALQPALHFHGREGLVRDLTDWVADSTSTDRVRALVAAGGTGKTAIVEQIVSAMRAGDGNVLVWSFYEEPDADAFLCECANVFLGETDGSASGRWERLQRGLRNERAHLVVLDGLERLQEEGGGSRVRGELSDHTIKLLLRGIALGLGRTRALVTSRFPLVDLEDWANRGYRETRLDDLASDAAIAVLRSWGVEGPAHDLAAAARQVGNHALSVAVVGSYLRSFADGSIDAFAAFDLDSVTGHDTRASKLARVLASYAARLPLEERELLARLSVFPSGVTLDLLSALADAGGDVAGILAKAKPRLPALLGSLRMRGLVFRSRESSGATWSAHPFLREQFGKLLNCPSERVFEVVAASLGRGLEIRPSQLPYETSLLDRYERLIEATRLAGRAQEAADLFIFGLGGHTHLGKSLGEYGRGLRILRSFGGSSDSDRSLGLPVSGRARIAHQRGLFAQSIGYLHEAWEQLEARSHLRSDQDTPRTKLVYLRDKSMIAFMLGKVSVSRDLADDALSAAGDAATEGLRASARGYRANAAHALGNIAAARRDFATPAGMHAERITPTREAFYPVRIFQLARHHLDLGELDSAHEACRVCQAAAARNDWNSAVYWLDTLFARIELARGGDASSLLDRVRAWTTRSGHMLGTIETHLLSSRILLAQGSHERALDEAQRGLQVADSFGYQLMSIELFTTMAQIRLAWPDPTKAIQAAGKALDLATHSDCQWAWGEADAAQVWGEAYFANDELPLAKLAFERALAVRRRIEHPGVAKTEEWLARVG